MVTLTHVLTSRSYILVKETHNNLAGVTSVMVCAVDDVVSPIVVAEGVLEGESLSDRREGNRHMIFTVHVTVQLSDVHTPFHYGIGRLPAPTLILGDFLSHTPKLGDFLPLL